MHGFISKMSFGTESYRNQRFDNDRMVAINITQISDKTKRIDIHNMMESSRYQPECVHVGTNQEDELYASLLFKNEKEAEWVT